MLVQPVETCCSTRKNIIDTLECKGLCSRREYISYFKQLKTRGAHNILLLHEMLVNKSMSVKKKGRNCLDRLCMTQIIDDMD